MDFFNPMNLPAGFEISKCTIQISQHLTPGVVTTVMVAITVSVTLSFVWKVFLFKRKEKKQEYAIFSQIDKDINGWMHIRDMKEGEVLVCSCNQEFKIIKK